MEATEYIKRKHFNLWYEIFKLSNGRFLSDPFVGKDEVFVHYYFKDAQDANRLTHSFNTLTAPIVEVNRSFWKRWKLKIGL